MFFRVSFVPKRSDLVAAVGKDGNIYWCSLSIQKFLNYKSDVITQRHATRELNQFIPKSVAPFKSKKVFTFAEMITLMKTVRKNFPQADSLPLLWSEGRVITVDATPRMLVEASPRLILTEQEDSVRIRDWVSLYVRNVLMEFSSMSKREPILCQKNKPTQGEIGPPADNSDQILPELEPMDLEYYNAKETETIPSENGKVREAQANELALPNPSLQLDVGSDTIPEEIYIKLNGIIYSYLNLDFM